MSDTTIEWTARYDATTGRLLSKGKSWNYVTGCEEISPGCDRCYAKVIAERFRGSKAFPHGFDVALHPERLELPLTWKKPCNIFVNSMSDWCHKDIPDEFTLRAFEVMLQADHHIYQLLTKRAPKMVQLVPKITDLIKHMTGSSLWPSHIWLGVTVESMAQRGRIAHLRKVPAQVRFISYEPALGPLADADFTDIHWIIAGSESGHGARAMNEQWVRDMRDVCIEKRIAFFLKQYTVNGKKVPLPELDGKVWNEYPIVR